MSIDVETARRVAKLARIQVDEGDLPALAGELSLGGDLRPVRGALAAPE